MLLSLMLLSPPRPRAVLRAPALRAAARPALAVRAAPAFPQSQGVQAGTVVPKALVVPKVPLVRKAPVRVPKVPLVPKVPVRVPMVLAAARKVPVARMVTADPEVPGIVSRVR
jgi:hypothetical protein